MGAANCDDTWRFSDVPGFVPSAANLSEAIIPFGVQPATQLSLDYILIENYYRALHSHTGARLPGQNQSFHGAPSSRDGNLRSGIPFEPLANCPNAFVVSADSAGLLYSSSWMSAVTANAVDQLSFVAGAQVPLVRYYDEFARFASHMHELKPGLYPRFGMAQPEATIVWSTPATEDTYGNNQLQIAAWRESPAGAAGDCVHLVVVNAHNGAVRFIANILGLLSPWNGFEWPCSCPGARNVCQICHARKLFEPGPQLNLSADGTLDEGWLGPGETQIYRIGCATPGTHPWQSPPANLVNNPSFEENGASTHAITTTTT